MNVEEQVVETDRTSVPPATEIQPTGDEGIEGEIEEIAESLDQANFADLLDEYAPKPLRRGELVEGEILRLEDNVAYVDVGSKRTAVIPPQDLEQLEDSYIESLSPGDEVLLYVLRTPVGEEDLLVSLHKGLQQQDWIDAKACMEKDELLKLEVVGHNKGGLLVEFGHLRGFIPNSHVPDLQYVRNQRKLTSAKAKMVGETLPLKIIEVNRDRRRLVLSVKAAQKEVRQRRLQELEEGSVITGTVTNIVDFGAFVDLDGVDGLIHISKLEWKQVGHPSEVLSVGEDVEVLIESVDIERERVSLNRKALLPNPWHQFADEFDEGDLVEGVVTNVVDFGVFVLLPHDIEGLIHVSEMRIYGDSNPEDVLQPGDIVIVRIVSIDPVKERIGLSQRRVTMAEEMNWMQRRSRPPEEVMDEATAATEEE